jgi:small-conductance mechanosensitive channel
MLELFDRTYFGNSVWQYALAAGIAVAALLLLLFLRRLVRSNYRRLKATPEVELMELPLKVISRTTSLFLLVVSLFVALQVLELPAGVARALMTVGTVAVFWQAGLWASTAVISALERRSQIAHGDRAAAGTLGIIGFLAKATIWSLILLLTLDNLGIQIKPLLAGLGIGGIAVALAVQNVLGDLFASLTITLDRPFVVGDALTVDDFSGTVEYIGIKSTRLRSISGEQIVMPNANLLSARVRNFARMAQRRGIFSVAVSLDTPHVKLKAIPGMIRAIVETQNDARFDRSHLARITPTAFEFETVYIMQIADYLRFMDVQQEIYLRMLEAFEGEGITIASPTQTLRLMRDPGVELPEADRTDGKTAGEKPSQAQ